MGDSWSDLRRRVARIGASLDVVVRSDPEVCGLSGLDYHLTLHHSGYGDCTVGCLTLINCPNELVLICLLYTSPSPRDLSTSRMPSSA